MYEDRLLATCETWIFFHKSKVSCISSILTKFQVDSRNIYRVIANYKNVFLTWALMGLRENCLQHARLCGKKALIGTVIGAYYLKNI